jgi:hypothetical protein
LAQKLGETQKALAAVQLRVPPEDAYEPYDLVNTVLGQPHYYRRGIEVNRDGPRFSDG